jgi:AraC-like DNA-binding protein
LWLFLIICVLFLLALGTALYVHGSQRSGSEVSQGSADLAFSQKKLQSFALGQMLLGNVPEFEQLSDFYRIYGLSFPSEVFMLLVAKIRRQPGGSEDLKNAYLTVQEELGSILSLSAEPYFVELGGLLICFYSEPRVTLSPPSSNQKPLRELLSQQCAACAASLLEQHGIDVLIALGRYDLGGFALHTNYLSAKALLEQAMCSRLPDNVVLDAGELTKKTDPEFSGAQRQFYNCFTCFQFSAAAEHLYHMVELRIQGYYDSFQEAKEVVAQQLRFCTNMLELPLNVSLSLEDGSRISIRDLMASPDAQALRENLYRYFSGLERQVSGTSAQAAPTTDRVRSYIENHYADPEISVSSVSQQFHLNVSYLSRQFKQEYGCGVLEFIHRLRISQAKELMSSGVQPSQVFSSVGYTSRRAFDSAFHRYEGITPKAYQDQLVAGKVS